jgi:hypothetical protein
MRFLLWLAPAILWWSIYIRDTDRWWALVAALGFTLAWAMTTLRAADRRTEAMIRDTLGEGRAWHSDAEDKP